LTVMWSTLSYGVVTLVQENLYIGIEVVEYPEDLKLDITDIIAPTNLKAGDTFIVKIKLKNIGKKKVDSIKAKLELPTGFASIGSDTEEYVESLEPNSSAETVFNIQVDKQAISQLYNFDFILEYRGENNRLITKNSSFGIMLEESPQLYIQDIILEPTKLTPGSNGLLMLQIVNAGTNKIKNAKIIIYGGDNLLTQSQNFIGEIKPGDSESTSFGIYINPNKIKIGKYVLTIQIKYDDLKGNSHIVSKIYPISIIGGSSLIPISGDFISILVSAIVFIIISYVIFYITGSRITS
ncbi:MAG: COG1361 S-layer family protein, partial [Methanosarcinales archaeon]